MKKKVWEVTVKDNPNRAVMGENDEFYTTDTEAFLVFNLQDEGFYPESAILTLENRNDGSLKSEEVEVTNGVIQWEMPERYIEHSGNWQVQLVYEQMKGDVPEKYTSGIMAFTVNSHIKDKKKPKLVEIENWEKFIREGTELIETWKESERERTDTFDSWDKVMDGVIPKATMTNPGIVGLVEEDYESDLRENREFIRYNQYDIYNADFLYGELTEILDIIDTKEDTLTPGENISIDENNVISAIGTIYDDAEIRSLIDNKADKQDLISHLATTDTDGLMSSTDKTKLDGIETGAEKNTITSVQGRTGTVTISKSDVGLGNVNNVAITSAQVTKLNELNYTKAMTQEQYDALSTAEKNRTDVWYGIYE